MTLEPASADPADVARKQAAAPGLRLPPPPEWILDENGRVVDYRMQGMTFFRKARNRIGELLFNMIITHIPSHAVRQGYLRLFGARIGKDTSILRGTEVLDIECGDPACAGSVFLPEGSLVPRPVPWSLPTLDGW